MSCQELLPAEFALASECCWFLGKWSESKWTVAPAGKSGDRVLEAAGIGSVFLFLHPQRLKLYSDLATFERRWV